MPKDLSSEAKVEALRSLEATLNKQFGDGAFTNLADRPQVLFDRVIPTGAISLDIALGIGGLPRGKIVELFGEEGSGKSTLALSVARQAQILGGSVVYIDAENVLDPEYCQNLGLDLTRFWLAQPSYGEEGLQIVESVLAEGAADVVVIDSVAALIPKDELDGTIEDNRVGTQARMMSKAMRRIPRLAREADAVVIFINQFREKIGVMYGDPRTTPGGRALKFASAVRLEVRAPASKRISGADKKTAIGQMCTVKIKKNKVGPPGAEADFELYYGKGIATDAALVQALIDQGLWLTRGAHIFDTDTGERIAQGRAAAGKWIVDNGMQDELIDKLYAGLRPIDDPTLPDEEAQPAADDAADPGPTK